MSTRRRYRFQLYVADETQNSLSAIANLTAICRKHVPPPYEIDIVDVLKEPEKALAEGILMTPTLVKLSPSPACRIVGTLSDTQTVIHSLGLEAEAA